MNQDNTKSVEIDVLALLHKLWTRRSYLILFHSLLFRCFQFLSYLFLYPTNIYINNAYLCC